MGDTKRSNGLMVRSRVGLWWGVWLVLALWVLPHPAPAQSPAAFNQGVAYTISWFYAAAFDRTPIPNAVLPYYGDIEGLAFWTRTYLAGEGALAPYRGNVYAIADFFVSSAEFQARFPATLTEEEFVMALYQNMLGRASDPGGLAFWVGRLANGVSRGTVLADFTNSDENRNANPLRKAALESYIAFIDADDDNSITPEEAAMWSATHPDLDGAMVDNGYVLPPFQEGQDYLRLVNPVPTATPEVIEFFSYTCPHCWSLQPMVRDWLARKPEEVVFVKVAFGGQNDAAYYVAQALGVLETIHQPLFDAIHRDGRRLNSVDELAQFFAEHGVDEEAFRKAYGSRETQVQLREAARLENAYARRGVVRGVPAVIVNGRYQVRSPRVFEVVDFLLARDVAPPR